MEAYKEKSLPEIQESYQEKMSRLVRVVFSDHKKRNLDGPDGCRHYWGDLRKGNFGGGSLMA
ncbi:hypothetical protein NECAME_18360 [Necator americanus]|uniref:Uncharacterized protein n=1 Tax=Necator americanus TaxID=51031 RepID=W2SV70_NECAM|nr:hypothetical protein NECAME_18360 [Necator americanus]ETN73408.1 hypothetical protein NECAME_18360 [Necator americanus]